jgi:hypothetical protein
LLLFQEAEFALTHSMLLKTGVEMCLVKIHQSGIHSANLTLNLELLHNREGATHVKNIFTNFFLSSKNFSPLGVKTCGESEFDVFKAKKRFPDSGNVEKELSLVLMFYRNAKITTIQQLIYCFSWSYKSEI